MDMGFSAELSSRIPMASKSLPDEWKGLILSLFRVVISKVLFLRLRYLMSIFPVIPVMRFSIDRCDACCLLALGLISRPILMVGSRQINESIRRMPELWSNQKSRLYILNCLKPASIWPRVVSFALPTNEKSEMVISFSSVSRLSPLNFSV